MSDKACRFRLGSTSFRAVPASHKRKEAMVVQALVVLCLVSVMMGCTSPGSVEEPTARTTLASTATPVSVAEPISRDTSAVESLTGC